MTSQPKVSVPKPTARQKRQEAAARQQANQNQRFMERMGRANLRLSKKSLKLQREGMNQEFPEFDLPPPAPPAPAAAPIVNPASPGALGIPLSETTRGDDAPTLRRRESDRLAIQKASLGTRALSTRGNAPKGRQDRGEVNRTYGTPAGPIIGGKVDATANNTDYLAPGTYEADSGGKDGKGGKGKGGGGKGGDDTGGGGGLNRGDTLARLNSATEKYQPIIPRVTRSELKSVMKETSLGPRGLRSVIEESNTILGGKAQDLLNNKLNEVGAKPLPAPKPAPVNGTQTNIPANGNGRSSTIGSGYYPIGIPKPSTTTSNSSNNRSRTNTNNSSNNRSRTTTNNRRTRRN